VLVGLEAGASVTAATASGLAAVTKAVSTVAEAAGVVTDTAAEPTSAEVGALTSAVTETEPTFTASEIPDFLGGERSRAAAVPA
jgi:hypothetical protein